MLSFFAWASLLLILVQGLSSPIDVNTLKNRPPILDPNRTTFPDSSLADFEFLLDAPAGKHGFLMVKDGHFYFQDGARAKFWGVNLAKDSIFQPKETVDEFVEVLARAGVNMVRIHHIDDLGGIIDYSQKDSRHLDERRLEQLDYLIYKLKTKGIYIYLDLLDYRNFQSGDGVENADKLSRGAKPCAVFNSKLIELQREYAAHLLRNHINPYTKLPYADDPAVALIELFDENGLFIEKESWRKLPEPYQSELKLKWNQWLKKKYGTTENLRKAWTNYRGECDLREGETLETNSVDLPDMTLEDFGSLGKRQIRKNEGALFAYEAHREYFKEMKRYLLNLGVKVPITAVGAKEQLPDLKSVSEELDFIGINYYWAHPQFYPGKEWQDPFYFSGSSELKEDGIFAFVPQVTIAKIHNKPLVIRELSFCWPNESRGAGILEAAAYGCLQDLDALVFFAYETSPDAKSLDHFDIHQDPTRWGLMGIGAKIFLTSELKLAKRKAKIAYSQGDTFYYYRYLNSIYHLGWVCQLETEFFDKEYSSGGDLIISAGRCAEAAYRSENTILFYSNRNRDLYNHQVTETPERESGYQMRTVGRTPVDVNFTGIMYRTGTVKTKELDRGFNLSEVTSKGFLPIGTNRDYQIAYGFYDSGRKNFVFRHLSDWEVLRVSLDSLRMIHKENISHRFVDDQVYRSDTGEIIRDVKDGLLTITSEKTEAISSGSPSAGKYFQAKNLRISTPAPIFSIVATSLDNKPLTDSENYLIKMVTVAKNTGELAVDSSSRYNTLRNRGRLPVSTEGKPHSQPTTVFLNNKKLIEVYMQNGTWELLMTKDFCILFCDTPEVKFNLYLEGEATGLDYANAEKDIGTVRSFIYPKDVKILIVRK